MRTPGKDEIYSVSIATYDAGVGGADWMNRRFLDIPQDKIASISIGDVTLEQKDGKFTLAGVKPEEKVKDAEIPPIVSGATQAAFDAVQGKGKDALAKVEPADFTVTVKRKEGDPIVYKYKKEEGGGAYLFSSSAHDFLFRVAEATVNPLVEAKREKLVEVKAAEKPKDEKPAETKPAAEAAEQPKPEQQPQVLQQSQPTTGTGG